MQEQVSDRLVGTLVDNRYAVRSKLARGGMSTVYLATDLRLERDVALKVLHPHLATDETFLDRLGRATPAARRVVMLAFGPGLTLYAALLDRQD